MIRIVVSDDSGNPGQHALDIKQAIINGYGSDISEQITIINGYNNAKAYAQNNENVIAFIRSYSGVAGYVNDAQSLYPRVQTFFPLGTNNYTLLEVFQNEEPPVIVVTGAGDLELRNNTGFGKGLEFWDKDLVDDNTGFDDQSSFGNGTVLGKLLRTKDVLNCSWWEARFRARMTADRTEPSRVSKPWDIYNGYGKINVAAALLYKGIVAADPYIPEPVQSVPELFYNDTQTLTSPSKVVPANTYFSNSKEFANYIADKILYSGFNYKGFIKVIDTDYGTSNVSVISSFSISSNNCELVLQRFLDVNSLNKNPLKIDRITLSVDAELTNYIYQWVNKNLTGYNQLLADE